jgi:phosphoribosylformimino-5-aminoimidazole carboxamide ribotide isomerase
MILFPAIDLRGGKCVRLTLGDFAQETTYSDDPVEVAMRFQDQGARWLHVVDLDGAKSGAPQQLALVRQICDAVRIPVQVGGGMRTAEAAARALDAGVARVIVGSALVSDPALADQLFTDLGDRVVAGIDARDGLVAVLGWQSGSSIRAIDLASDMERRGCQRIIFTDIGRDGTLTGPNIPALQELIGAVTIPIIASGGVSCDQDLTDLVGLVPPPEGAILGKSLYEGRIELAKYGGVVTS